MMKSFAWITSCLPVVSGVALGLALVVASNVAQPTRLPLNTAHATSMSMMPVAQGRQCERRSGPYATQDTAWRRWREARAQGYTVSRGVVQCHDQRGTRGYCFSIFDPC